MSGNPLVKPLLTNVRIDITKDMMDDERSIVEQCLLVDLFRTLSDNPTMTATQAMELVQERSSLTAPVSGRIESEFLGPLIEREIDIAIRAGQMSEMPLELIEARGDYKIEFKSPMARAARASEGVAIIRTFEAITPLAQIDPTVMFAFKVTDSARVLGEINGFPAKLMNTEDEVAQMKDDHAQQQQADQLMQAAPQLSATANNMVKLQQGIGAPQ
jgi:hypothetical protein